MHDGKGVVQDRLARISKGSTNGNGHADGASPMQITPQFCPPGMDPFDTVEWDKRTAHIKDENGGILFEQTDCEVPKTWSALATNVVVSKYFYGEPGTPERESSVRQVIFRVARTIADWGIADGYFETREDGENFYRDLAWMCLHQYGSFNSPVWFNVGLYHQYGIKGSRGNYHWDPKTGAIHRPTTPYEYPQASACFIQSVDDNMEDIMRLATSEAMLFKYGSGTGTDLSTLRSAREKLSGGGIPSGPLSFMRVYDQIAAVVKSGGKTRRAAKMQSLKDWHPDILEFIQAKAKEEKKARTLIESGEYDANFNGEAYSSIMFQNANLSVRVSDDFMQSAVDGRKWRTHWVTDPKVAGPEHEAKYLMRQIAEGTWYCGDPGRAIRDDDQPLAHLPGHRADQRVESVLRVHVPRRHGVQPVQPQPEEVPGGGRPLQRRAVPPGGLDLHHGSGDPGRSRELSDAGDRRKQPRVPAAGAGLREPGQPAHVDGHPLRQRRRPRHCRCAHRPVERRRRTRLPAASPPTWARLPVTTTTNGPCSA